MSETLYSTCSEIGFSFWSRIILKLISSPGLYFSLLSPEMSREYSCAVVIDIDRNASEVIKIRSNWAEKFESSLIWIVDGDYI